MTGAGKRRGPRATHRNRPLPWVAVVLIWALWALWSIQQRTLAALVTGIPAQPRVNPWQLTMVTAGFWAAATLVIMATTRQITARIATRPRRLLAHGIAFLALHVTDATVYWLASALAGSTPPALVSLLFSLVTFNALAYTAVAFACHALDAAAALRERTRRETQLESQLALAQLHVLRAQLQPHFLFNALNAVSSLIHSDPQRADRMLARFSDLLRTAVDTAPRPEVPLAEELAFARRYLEIEQMRYGHRLTIRIAAAEDLGQVMVPNMVLQPLLENAVRHGVAPHARPGSVEVEVGRSGDHLRLSVCDSGAGFDTATGLGAGLRITAERLRALYGEAHQIAFSNWADGFEVRVTVPLRYASPAGAP